MANNEALQAPKKRGGLVAIDSPRQPVTETPGSARVRVGNRLRTSGDILRELGRLYRRMRKGEIESSEATRYAFVLQVMARVIETSLLEQRIEQLERRNGPIR